jgi:hypothetical protein
MSEAAWAFEQVPLELTKSKPVRVTGVLRVANDLEEVQVLGAVGNSIQRNPRVRAFRVRRDLRSFGLQKGDCLLVQPKKLAPNELAVVSADGVFSVRRVVDRRGERVVFDSVETSSRSATPRVIGGFAGILRKRLANPDHHAASSQRDLPLSRGATVSGKVRWLRGKLGMVESTYAETSNPRLQRALRHEAEILRKQLQNEAGAD